MSKKALLLLGCPELPVQTSIALYLTIRLKNAGMEVFVAGTDAALELLKVSDPEGHYVDEGKMINLDKCIEVLAEKRIDFDFCSVFVHNDVGISYLATMHEISNARLFAIIFGTDVDSLTKIFPYIKPCHGTFVLKIEGKKEIVLLRMSDVGKK